MENKLFKANYDKKNYQIIIDVCENANTFMVNKLNQDFNITYDSLIGVLEIVKMNFIKLQSDENRTIFDKQKNKNKNK